MVQYGEVEVTLPKVVYYRPRSGKPVHRVDSLLDTIHTKPFSVSGKDSPPKRFRRIAAA